MTDPAARVAELEAEVAAARETNARLNRRAQAAEAGLADWHQMMRLPSDERGVRFVSGSLGRALLAATLEKLVEENQGLEAEVARLTALMRQHAQDWDRRVAEVTAERDALAQALAEVEVVVEGYCDGAPDRGPVARLANRVAEVVETYRARWDRAVREAVRRGQR